MEDIILSHPQCEFDGLLDETYPMYLMKHKLRQQLNLELENYISTLTHDLKTPVLAQIRALELLLSNSAKNLTSGQKEFITLTLEACREQYEIIKNLITTFKYKKEEIELRDNNFDVIELLKYNINSLRELILKKKNKIRLSIDKPSLIISADKEKLSDALVKIFKYMINKISYDSEISVVVTNSGHSLSIKLEGQSHGDSAVFSAIGAYPDLWLATEVINAHQGEVTECRLGDSKLIEIRLPMCQAQY